MKRNYIMSAKSIRFSFVPFYWIWPRLDESICDTTVFFGPFRIGWVNP